MFVAAISESVDGVLYFDVCKMLLVAAANLSQSSYNYLSNFASFLFGIRVELEFETIPVSGKQACCFC